MKSKDTETKIMAFIFIFFSPVPQHFGEFLGWESELISWWGFFPAVSWLLFWNSFSAHLANSAWPTLGAVIWFSLKKWHFPSSELCLCFFSLPDFFFNECSIPLLLSKNVLKSLFPSPDIMGEKSVLLTRRSEPDIKMSDSARSLSWSTWQTLWENDGFTICGNPRRYHFS